MCQGPRHRRGPSSGVGLCQGDGSLDTPCVKGTVLLTHVNLAKEDAEDDDSIDTRFWASMLLLEVVNMPRVTRMPSESGVYHVMARGINQSQLFYDDEDRQAFLERLGRYKAECGFFIYAWCLMGNHVHLLVREGDVALSDAMKRLLLSYSHYFNGKYDRKGYLYQDRYGRKPVDGDSYLLAAVRYIHRNPLEVGESIRYWTSFDEYMGSSWLTDTDFVLDMFADDRGKAREAFKEFVEGDDKGCSYSFDPAGTRLRDAEAIEVIKSVADVRECSEVCSWDRDALAELLQALKRLGLSVRQIARLTGLNRGVVQRA